MTNNLKSETKPNSDTFLVSRKYHIYDFMKSYSKYSHKIIIKFVITWSDSSCISRLCRLWSFGEFSCVSDSSLSAIPESCDFPFERELWRLLSTDAARRERSARVFKRLRLRGGSPKLATRLKKFKELFRILNVPENQCFKFRRLKLCHVFLTIKLTLIDFEIISER